jgi:AraC family transcriptional activator of pobA
MKPSCIHDENHFKSTDVLYIGFKCNISAILENGVYKDDYQRSIFSLLKQMKREVLEQKQNFNLKLDFLLGELLIDLERMNGQTKRCVDLTYVLGFIDEHSNQHIDLGALAELSGYSYHRFRHVFKQITGYSPIKYILAKRLKSAAQYLEQTTLTILEISQECGFSNESQFSSMFKKYTGLTPSMYRKKGQELV